MGFMQRAATAVVRHIAPLSQDGHFSPKTATGLAAPIQGKFDAAKSSYGAGILFGDHDLKRFLKTGDIDALIGITLERLKSRYINNPAEPVVERDLIRRLLRSVLKSAGLFDNRTGEINLGVKAAFDRKIARLPDPFTPEQWDETVMGGLSLGGAAKQQWRTFLQYSVAENGGNIRIHDGNRVVHKEQFEALCNDTLTERVVRKFLGQPAAAGAIKSWLINHHLDGFFL